MLLGQGTGLAVAYELQAAEMMTKPRLMLAGRTGGVPRGTNLGTWDAGVCACVGEDKWTATLKITKWSWKGDPEPRRAHSASKSQAFGHHVSWLLPAWLPGAARNKVS